MCPRIHDPGQRQPPRGLQRVGVFCFGFARVPADDTAEAMADAVDRQQGIGPGCVMKGIRMPLGATGREMGIVG